MTLRRPGGLSHTGLGFHITPLARVRAANFMRVTEVKRERDREVKIKGKKKKITKRK